MNVGTWNNHTFEVSNRRIRGFTGLTVKGGSETEYKTTSSQKYVSRKNSNPLEVSMTAILNRSTGCDVRKEAIALLRDSYNGAKGYFFLGVI